MSQEHVEIVRRGIDAYNRRDLDGRAECWTADLHPRAAEGALDDRGPIHGKAEMRAYLQDWFDTFDGLTVEPRELIVAGTDQAGVVLRLAGRAKLSGVETDVTSAGVYTIRDGKIARRREYVTRNDALEAAGLGE